MNLIDELIETLELMLNPNSADLGIKLFLERDFDGKEFSEVLIGKNRVSQSKIIFVRYFKFGVDAFFVCVYDTRESYKVKEVIEKLKQLRNEIN